MHDFQILSIMIISVGALCVLSVFILNKKIEDAKEEIYSIAEEFNIYIKALSQMDKIEEEFLAPSKMEAIMKEWNKRDTFQGITHDQAN